VIGVNEKKKETEKGRISGREGEEEQGGCKMPTVDSKWHVQ